MGVSKKQLMNEKTTLKKTFDEIQGKLQVIQKEQEAYNLEMQAEQDRLIAMQNENRRRNQANIILSANLANQAYKNRDDKSFEAFLDANEATVAEDIGGIQLSAFMADVVSKQKQEVARSEGQALFEAGLLGAATTLGTGYYNYRRLA